MDTMFVVVRPRAWSPAAVARVRACLAATGACVEAEGTVTIGTLLCTSSVARFFGSTHYWAASATDAALRHPLGRHAAFCAAEEDVKSLFYAHFGELWDAALDAGRLRTALDVMQQDGISAHELAGACATAASGDSKAVLTLPSGLTITRLPPSSSARVGHEQPPKYVANGAYPAELATFQQSRADEGLEVEEPGCWWCAVSWPALDARQQQLQAQLPGQLAEVVADPHGLDVITGPLQALACRVCWAQVPLRDDPFARTLVRNGVPLAGVEVLVRGPTLHEQGRFKDVFDLVADESEADAAQTLAELWTATLRRAAATADRDGAAVLYDWDSGRVDVAVLDAARDSEDAAAAATREHGLVLVHPRVCATTALTQRLKTFLVEQQPEVRVEAAREDVAAAELHAKLDLHYGDVARYALDQDALRRLAADEADDVAAAVQHGFQAAFGLSWDAAIQEGRLWSTALAEDLLGEALAEALLKLCASGASAVKTHPLSPALAVTEVPRETLWTALNPLRPVEALTPAAPPSSLSSSSAPSHDPNRLTAASYFIVNAVYGVYRRDVMTTAEGAAQEHVGAVWQLSWPAGTSRPDVGAWCHAAAASAVTPGAEEEEEVAAPANDAEPDVVADYEAAATEAVCAAFPLLHLTAGAFAALRGRHLWWGTPYDDDTVSRALLEATGQSWASSVPTAPAAQADTHEAVLALLPPSAATEEAISLVCATLEESGVTLVESADLFAQDAFEYVSSGSTELAVARRLAQETGTALWDRMSDALRVAFTEAAMVLADRPAQAFSPLHLYGGCVVCAALRVPPFVLEEGWRATQPVYVAEGCWLGYLAALEVWVVNGHIAIMQQRYEETAARVHLLRLRWDASASTWDAMRNALVGPETTSEAPSREEELYGVGAPADSSSSAGAVTLLFAHLAERTAKAGTTAALLAGEPTYFLSPTAFHGLVDVLRWPGRGRSGPLSAEVATEDWLLRRALVRRVLERGASSMSLIVQQVRETLETVLPPSLVPPTAEPAGAASAAPVSQSTPAWTSRFARSQRDVALHHGFLWLHPSSSTPAVCGAIPELLFAHGVRVRASGAVQIDTPVGSELLDVKHDAFYKNAYVRSAAQVPITDAEAQGFAKHFDQSWVTAVQLGLVLNAREAEQRFGTVPVTQWWNSLGPAHQVKLSESLYVGYMPREGLYVMNAPYSYRRARLHAGGHEAAWFAVEWDTADLSWAAFKAKVVGAADPAAAADGSLRHHFGVHWTRYSLPGKPDAIECVLHASESPLAALAERCRWLSITPRQDPYGCLLLQSGVTPSLLTMLLANPPIYSRDTGIIAEAFDRLKQEDVRGLVRQLREEQCRCTTLVLPEGTRLVPPASAAIVDPAPTSTAATAATRRGRENASEVPKNLSVLEQLRAYRHVALGSAVDPFERCRFATAHRQGHAPSASFAVLYLDPTSVAAMAADAPAGLRALRGMLVEQLSRRGVRVVQERVVQSATAAEAAVLYRAQHHREYRYGVAVPATESLGDSLLWQSRFKQRFGVSYQHDSVALYNSAEMAQVMRIADAEVAALWHRSQSRYPSDFLVLGEGCVVQRLQPGKPFYLMNGAVTESEQQFVTNATASAGVHAWLLAWDSARTDMGHTKLQQLLAELQSSAGVLRRCLTEAQTGDDAAGRVVAPTSRDSAAPFLFASESALAAVRQRQIWWQLPLWSDPTVAAWLAGDPATSADRLAPCAVTWALQDPLIAAAARAEGEPVHLWDVVIGMDATRAAARVRRYYDAAVAADAAADVRRAKAAGVALTRNTAVIAVSPQLAANSAVHQLVHAVLQGSGVRVETQGFIADHGLGAAPSKSLVRYLYPEDWSYATEEPADLTLSDAEAQAVADVFGAPWSTLLASGRLLPASRATKRLGGMTAPQLRLFVKGAKKALWVRPHLHIAELEEYGVYVINAHVPLTAHAIASTAVQTPIPYYIVSFSPSTWTWEVWLEQVIGSAEPTLAVPSSIRGRLAASWSALGIHAAPERAEGGGGGVCVSEGPLQSLLCRLHVHWPPLDSFDGDVVGSLVPDDATVTVLQAWLRNPTVACDDTRVGVLTHLAGWDTREVLHLAETLAASSSPSAPLLPFQLAAARHAEQEAVAWRATEATWAATFAQRFQLPRLLPADAADAGVLKGSGTADADRALLHRNVGTLLFFSHQLDAALQARLRQHLEAYGVAVTATAKYEEGEQECTAALLDRLYAPDAFYADRHHIATALLGDGEVAAEDQARFNTIFRDDVPWQELLEHAAQEEKLDHRHAGAGRGTHPGDAGVGGRCIYSAADAAKRWRLTPRALWHEARRGVSMQLAEGLVVTRLSPVVPSARTDNGGAPAAASSCEEEGAAAAPWEGHYVVNAFYAALRDALCPAAAPSDSDVGNDEVQPEGGPVAGSGEFVLPSLIKWNIAWEAGTLSWQDLCQRVVGCADYSHAGAAATTESFNATLAAAAAQEPRPLPSPLSSVGVMASSGPLAAFAVRRAWCWNADHHDVYLPDPFLRTVAVAGLDGTVIQEDGWLGNPIIAATAQQHPAQPRLRVFDWTRGCDTPAVLAWMRWRDQPPLPAATGDASDSAAATASVPAHATQDAAEKTQDASSVAASSVPAGEAGSEVPEDRPPTPPPRMKTQLQVARVRDALLGARTEEDWQQLWRHYRALSGATTSSASDAADTAAAAVPTSSTVNAAEPPREEETIPFALFHRDFTSLDSFGVPCTSLKLKRLFLDIEIKKGGRMNYAELTRALALYHAL